MSKMQHQIKDPVCGMDMKPKEVSERSEHQGRTYYFCGSLCKDQFEKDPKKYATKEVA